MSTLWSGRFTSAPDQDVFAFGASFAFDRRLFEDDVEGSRAWAEALQQAGVLSPDELSALDAALTELIDAAVADPTFVSGKDEDVHSFVERQLVARVGATGKRLHTGRSRNEQVALDLRLYLRRRVRALQGRLRTLVDAFCVRAADAGDAPLPAYTHLRRAQPVLEAHYWLAHASAFRRACDRFDAVYAEADVLPLGSGAIAGNSFPIDVEFLRTRLGFARIAFNSMDTVSDRDFVSSFLHACALAMVHVSRLAEDVIVYGSEEFGFFELDDSVTTGSSLMPQKKNPDPMELVRGKTGRLIGRHTGWLASMKGLPSGYNKDLQEDKEAVFDAEDTLAGSLMSCEAVVRTLRVRREITRRAAGGFMLATDVADYLVRKGLPFRDAHELVGGLVRTLLEEQRAIESLTPDEWRRFSPLFEDDVVEAITPLASIQARRTPQSTAPGAVAARLADMQAWIGSRG
ncbi:MAG TPA: argininosuccinate lyase [Luteitalea sp.]|nr:argininosuccinate lyase [Luteitalea sp.]